MALAHTDLGAAPDHAALAARAADFLYREAALLDDWQLDEWLSLMTDDISYRVPAWGFDRGTPRDTLHVVNDDLQLLSGRVTRLKSKHAHAESPKSHTRRLVTNVRVLEVADRELVVGSNFYILRTRLGQIDHFVGSYRHRLRRGSEGPADFKICERLAVLDHSVVDAGGTVSIVL